MNKAVVAMAAFGVTAAGAALAIRRYLDRVEEASQYEAPDESKVMRAIELATQGLDEALREDRLISPIDIHNHVRRGHEFDEEWS